MHRKSGRTHFDRSMGFPDGLRTGKTALLSTDDDRQQFSRLPSVCQHTHCPRSAAHALLPRASRTCTASVEAHIEDEGILVQTLKSKQRAIVLA